MIQGPRKHLWLLLLATASLVALVGWWGNTRLRSTLQGTLRAELTTSLEANVTALEIWITNQTRLVKALAEDPHLRTLALERFENGPPPLSDRRRGPPSPGRSLEGIDAYLEERLSHLGHEGMLVGTNLTVVAASGRGRIRLGMPVFDLLEPKFAELFLTGQPVLVTPFRPPTPDFSRFRPPGGSSDSRFGSSGDGPDARRWPDARRSPRENPGWRASIPADFPVRGELMLMQVAAPIRDEAGAVRGALALIMDPEREFSRVLSATRFGDTGETYGFDSSGLMISRSRFDAGLREMGLIAGDATTAALTLPLVDPGGDLTDGFAPTLPAADRPLIRAVTEALAGRAGVAVQPYRDYRGVAVVGAWRWLPQHDFGIVTQIDASEAYEPLRVLRMLFLLLFLLLVFSANGFFLASYLGVRWRLRLSEVELEARRLGQYQLEEKIGEGGMGVVYRGRHALLRRDTAIKLLLPDRADPEAVERFEREVQLTSQLTHPNTVQIYDYGHTPEGVFYYAMEYLRGLNLKELITHFGPQPEPRVTYILGQICDALHEAHQNGLVHRDIKPANIFLSHRGGVPDAVKVLDFGLVQEFRLTPPTDPTAPGKPGLVGTPLFMSPESIRSPGPSDPRTDIYSLGALGYYLVTGQYVFGGATAEEVTRQQLHSQPIPPSQRAAIQLTRSFETAILRCLEKDPARRPASVLELKTSLEGNPHAAQWTREDRAAWWSRHETEILQLPRVPAGAAAPGLVSEVRVDMTTRTA
jgi:hypothetical protein